MILYLVMDGTGKRETEAQAYTDIARPLVVTRTHKGARYSITHAHSGFRVTDRRTLREAKMALAYLLSFALPWQDDGALAKAIMADETLKSYCIGLNGSQGGAA